MPRLGFVVHTSTVGAQVFLRAGRSPAPGSISSPSVFFIFVYLNFAAQQIVAGNAYWTPPSSPGAPDAAFLNSALGGKFAAIQRLMKSSHFSGSFCARISTAGRIRRRFSLLASGVVLSASEILRSKSARNSSMRLFPVRAAEPVAGPNRERRVRLIGNVLIV